MAQVFTSNLERDGEHRAFKARGRAVVGSAGAAAIVKGTFEPGWRWTKDVQPLAGTESCEIHHLGYIISGRMGITFDDGSKIEVADGDLFDVQPGHDAYVIGDQPCVTVDFSPDATRYAKGPAAVTPQVEDRYLSLVRKGYAAFNTGDIET